MPNANKNSYDVSQIFQTFITFGGDVEKTSVALDVSRDVIREFAIAENWGEKIKDWQGLRNGDAKDLQIQINRAVNYVQAHRMRSVVDKVLAHFQSLETAELVQILTEQGRDTSKFSARPLTDLVKAAETCQLMTARALGDTAAERPADDDGAKSGSNIGLMVMKAMESADKVGLDSVEIVRQELGHPRI